MIVGYGKLNTTFFDLGFIIFCVLILPLDRVLAAPNTACRNQAEYLLQKQWQSLNQWREIPSPIGHIRTERSPTKTVGAWVEVVQASGELVAVSLITPHEITEVRFDQDCRSRKTTSQANATNASSKAEPLAEGFDELTDAWIQRAVLNAKPGIIYVWSPHMQISILGLIEAQAAAKAAKIELTAVLSKESDLAYAKAANVQYNLKLSPILVNRSLELSLRNIESHLPSMVLYKDSQLLNQPFRGYEDRLDYAKIFKDYLGDRSLN